jgi:hypothetical protein
MPVSQRLLARKVKRGSVLRDRSFQPSLAPMLMAGPLKSNGREACRSMIAPSEPSSFEAEVDLRTVTLLNSSEAKMLKSNWRLRLAPPEPSLPPVVARASRPFRRTTVKSAFRPRTVIVRPSPPSRSIDTPGHALQRLGQVQVGEVGDVLRLDDVDEVVFTTLYVKSIRQAGPETGDDHFLDGGVFGGRSGRRFCAAAAPAIASAISRRCWKHRASAHGRAA